MTTHITPQRQATPPALRVHPFRRLLAVGLALISASAAFLAPRAHAQSWYLHLNSKSQSFTVETVKCNYGSGERDDVLFTAASSHIGNNQRRYGQTFATASGSDSYGGAWAAGADFQSGTLDIYASATPEVSGYRGCLGFTDYRDSSAQSHAEFLDWITVSGPFQGMTPVQATLRARLTGTMTASGFSHASNQAILSAMNFSVSPRFPNGGIGGSIYYGPRVGDPNAVLSGNQVYEGAGPLNIDRVVETTLSVTPARFELAAHVLGVVYNGGLCTGKITLELVLPPGFTFTSDSGVFLRPPNTKPTADAGGPYILDLDGILVLNGTGSSDPDLATGDSLTYGWDVNGDGNFADFTGATPAISSAQLSALGMGPGTYEITLRVTDSAGLSDTDSTTLTLRDTQSIAFDPISNHIYGDAPFQIHATASSGLPVTFTSLTPSVATVSGNTVTIVASGMATIRASQSGDAIYQPAVDVDQTFTVAKATPVITWITPADISLGTPLSSSQLNATANVPGTFIYTPAAGTVLGIGNGRVLRVDFTPTDGDHASASMAVMINVYELLPSGFRYERIKSFGNPDLAAGDLQAPLMVGNDGLLYGTSSSGGAAGYGIAFRIHPDGTGYTVLHSFGAFDGDGRKPRCKLIQGSDGRLYGTTERGGAGDQGIVFILEPEGGGYMVLRSFAGTLGSFPYAGLMEGSDGVLYGTTTAGGNANAGVVFRINADGSGHAVLHHFTGSGGDGKAPYAPVVQGGDGALYGTTYQGGTAGVGTVFKVQPDGSGYVVLHSLQDSGGDGAYPIAGLMLGPGGGLYGTTSRGGSTGYAGSIYKINPDGSGYAVVHSFSGSAGAFPYATLVQGSDGGLYGTTQQGSPGAYGTIFKIKADGSDFSVLRNFEGTGQDGFAPQAGLVAGEDGMLYGTTLRGGLGGNGTVFAIRADGSGYRVLRGFSNSGVDGALVAKELLEGSDGRLYGATYNGGRHNNGTVFTLNADGSGYAILHDFSNTSGNGRTPSAGLMQLSDGTLYGTTQAGSGGLGTVYKIQPDGTGFSILHQFSGAAGSAPRSVLIQGEDGALYGTTSQGGSGTSAGVIFKLKPDGTGYTVLHAFAGSDGRTPGTKLLQGPDGTLYGVTISGGANNYGTVFRINQDGTDFSVLHDFPAFVSDGRTPAGDLLLASDGGLYGTTYSGGNGGGGTVFTLRPDGTGYSLVHSFTSGEAQGVSAGLIECGDGALYGTAYAGGLGFGSVFKAFRDGSPARAIYRFSNASGNGHSPQSALVLGSDGALYGATSGGGDLGLGTLFRLIPANHAPTVEVPPANLSTTYGATFSATIPSGTFADLDTAQILSYAASGLPAGLVFNPDTRAFSGVPTAHGNYSITLTATDDGLPNLSTSTTFNLVVAKAALTVTADTFTRYYGEANPPLTGTITGMVNGDNITATYGTTATPTSPAGVYTIFVTLNDPDSRLGNYQVSTFTGALRIERAPQTITFGTIPAHVYGDAPFAVPVSASSGLPVTLTSSAAAVATVSGNTLTITGAGTTLLTAYQPGDGNYEAATFVQVSYTVGKGTPVITWAAPADINCQMVLGGSQLNATVNAPGTLTYNPPAGSTLPLGDGQMLSVNFAPADPGNWNPAAATTTVNVRLDAGMAVLWETATPNTSLATLALAPDQQAAAIGYSWGSSLNYSVAKYSAVDGSVIWQKSYDTPVNSYDEAKEGAVDAAGNVAVTGYSFVSGGNQDYLTARYAAADGTLLWVKRYNGAANADDQGRAVAVDADGNVVVTGHSWNGSNWDIHTLKYAAADGAILWEQHFNGPANGQDYGTVIAVDSTGNVVIAGSSASDYYTAKYAAADGALLWQTTYTRGDDQIMSMTIDGQDNVIVTGFSSGPGTGYDYYTAKYAAADGSLVWGQHYNSPQNRDEFGGSVVVDAVGDVIVAGHANNGSTSDYVTVKYAAQNGALLWERRFANQLGFLEGRTRLAVDAAGNAVFAGLIRHADNTRENYTVSYTSADGAVQWEHRAPTTGNVPRPVVVNADGDVITTGNLSLLLLRYGTQPVVSLVGEPIMTVEMGTTFSDPGATAVDGCGTVLPVTVAGVVDVFTAGDYTLTYVATDAAGQSRSATRSVAVVITDHPPVAIAGDDINAVASPTCIVRLHLDGSASYDPDGDPLAYSWIWRDEAGEVVMTSAGGPYPTWDYPIGIYTVELTVTSTRDGVTQSSTDTLIVNVLPGAPLLDTLTPSAAYANGPAFALVISGGCFLPGATVYWNGSPRTTTVVSGSELVAAVPTSDLNTGVEISVATVQVVNGDGQVSNPLGFSIVAQTVGTVDGAVSEPGETSTVSTAPTTEGEPGATVVVQNSGDEPVTVLAATYDERPVGETVFQVDNGSFVDVQVTGANENVAATVFFYYPSDVTGGMENRVKLRYFDGVDWIPVLSSGGLPPAKDTTDNLDGTVSGGRFTVVFDMTSTPKITELTGTVFGMFESQPQIDTITGPTGPVALGNPVTVAVEFIALGQQDAVAVNFVWDDGTETTVEPQIAGSASATHLYAAPGVYGVTVQVADAEGDMREGRFEYVVIYDPDGGFVTGGGWIASPAGAYVFDPTLAGKATFGFNSKYQKGKTVPAGETQFQFQTGDFKFHSTAYEWLVVSGAKAQYKGVGQVNGAGNYGFLLTATDGQVTGGGGVDEFRIKIWDRSTGTVVYDNVLGASDDMDAANPQALGGGSIVVQKGK